MTSIKNKKIFPKEASLKEVVKNETENGNIPSHLLKAAIRRATTGRELIAILEEEDEPVQYTTYHLFVD